MEKPKFDTAEKFAAFVEKRNEKGPKRPYTVTVTLEVAICVIAESQADAEDIALEYANEEADVQDADWHAAGATPLVEAGEFTDSIPYGAEGDDRDKTVDAWLAEVTKS